MTGLRPSRTPLFDAAHLARYTGGDEALTAELMSLMSAQARRCMDLMANCGPDARAWCDAAHTLKGAAQGVGAFALAELCDVAEAEPQQPREPVLEQLQACLDSTEAAFAAALSR